MPADLSMAKSHIVTRSKVNSYNTFFEANS